MSTLLFQNVTEREMKRSHPHSTQLYTPVARRPSAWTRAAWSARAGAGRGWPPSRTTPTPAPPPPPPASTPPPSPCAASSPDTPTGPPGDAPSPAHRQRPTHSSKSQGMGPGGRWVDSYWPLGSFGPWPELKRHFMSVPIVDTAIPDSRPCTCTLIIPRMTAQAPCLDDSGHTPF